MKQAGIRHMQVEGTAEVEIAMLRRNRWKRGLGTEITQAFVAIWRNRKLSTTLIGIASCSNEPPRRILAKVELVYDRDATCHEEAVALHRARH